MKIYKEIAAVIIGVVLTTASTEATTELKTEVVSEVTTEQKTEETTEVIEETTEAISVNSGGHLTRAGGVFYFNGYKETWYSTNEVAGQNTAVDIPGKHADENGLIRDADGYICVASSDLPFYTVIETSWGTAKVYDCGCSHGTIDIYTTW